MKGVGIKGVGGTSRLRLSAPARSCVICTRKYRRGVGGGPMKRKVLGALRPTVGNTVGLITRFSGRYPINMREHLEVALVGARAQLRYLRPEVPVSQEGRQSGG